jgi:tRNA G18 (ribose-2'-O)-methylase SpoU
LLIEDVPRVPLTRKELISQVNVPYLLSLLQTYVDETGASSDLGDAAERLRMVIRDDGTLSTLRETGLPDQAAPDQAAPDQLVRAVAVFLERLADEAGVSRRRSDTERSQQAVSRTTALPVVLYLPHIRSPFNLGNMIRTAAAFGLVGVVTGRDCPALDHPRLLRAAMGTLDMIPVVTGDLYDARAAVAAATNGRGTTRSKGNREIPTVVLETGGTSVYEVVFPQRGVLVAGHEELGVPSSILRASGPNTSVVTIPHGGPKSSLNVGVATGIALAFWDSRYLRTDRSH